jgi:hypothetical protein
MGDVLHFPDLLVCRCNAAETTSGMSEAMASTVACHQFIIKYSPQRISDVF